MPAGCARGWPVGPWSRGLARLRWWPVFVLVISGTLLGCSDPVSETGDGDGDGGEVAWLSNQLIASDDLVRIERVSYESDGLRIDGQVCRPQRSGRFPVILVNHGGWEGIGSDWGELNGSCGVLARLGNVAVMSSYRGEDGSTGQVEFCAGEATDVRNMLAIVRTASYADPQRIVMYGGSHGGCVSVRALQQGMSVRRAASWNGPTDMAELYQTAQVGAAQGSAVTPRDFYVELLAAMDGAFGAPPAENPGLYTQRSTLTEAAALSGSTVPLLLQHGAADDVVLVSQSCRLAERIGGFRAYHVGVDGGVVAGAPAACAAQSLDWRNEPVPEGSWPAQRYLIVYDGQSHGAGANLDVQLRHLLSFLQVM